MQEAVFNALVDLALNASGQTIPASKAYLIEARLAHIARREGFGSLEDLVHCLESRQNPVFRSEIAAALLSRDTWFFREPGSLEALVRTRLPERVAASPAGRIRVWCAGGSTGQEAYSLAMLLEDEPPPGLAGAKVEILSTDICKVATEKARQGVFGHYEVQRGLSIQRLLKHFTRLDSGDWQASEALRTRVSFRLHNLLEPAAGLGKFDIILCRNVLTEMARSARVRVAESLAKQLAPGGLILLAQGETLHGLCDGLEPASDIRCGWVAAGTANAKASAA
ncbi:protein-glutamate O-methyltransferase CheR [Hyphomonas sp.]|uniref:CheR family methyltransferase n=1 Tax=Hyphomonas sp. TaxID=87 RepID=UPI0025B918BA|nr:protein-glutamate O-methyltransferase CheR [Hyphomonas sp.]MBI1401218.1 chemotaxis protein CheR [Hyphomonas sp.]